MWEVQEEAKGRVKFFKMVRLSVVRKFVGVAEWEVRTSL